MNIFGLLEFARCMSAIEGFMESVGFLISLARLFVCVSSFLFFSFRFSLLLELHVLPQKE